MLVIVTSKRPMLKSPVLYRKANTFSNSSSNCMQQIDSEAVPESNYQLYQNTFGVISSDVRVTPAAVAELEKSRRIDSLHWFCCFLTDLVACNLNLRFKNLEAEFRADFS